MLPDADTTILESSAGTQPSQLPQGGDGMEQGARGAEPSPATVPFQGDPPYPFQLGAGTPPSSFQPGAPLIFANLAADTDSGLPEYEVRRAKAAIVAGAPVPMDLFKSIFDLLGNAGLQAVILRIVLTEWQQISRGGATPQGCLAKATGRPGTSPDEVIKAIYALGAGDSFEARIFSGLGILDLISKILPIASYAGERPYRARFEILLDAAEGIQFELVTFLYATGTLASTASTVAKRAAGIPVILLDPAYIEPHISRLMGIIAAGGQLNIHQQLIIQKIKDIHGAGQEAKRAKISASQPSIGSAAASGAAHSISPQGNYPPGKVIFHCFEFQRPSGCSKFSCTKDHVLVGCIHHPKCKFAAEKCFFHHQ